MLKVILLIAGMSIEQTIEFNDMESCLEVRASVLEQDPSVDALCIPMGTTDLQFHEFVLVCINVLKSNLHLCMEF